MDPELIGDLHRDSVGGLGISGAIPRRGVGTVMLQATRAFKAGMVLVAMQWSHACNQARVATLACASL